MALVLTTLLSETEMDSDNKEKKEKEHNFSMNVSIRRLDEDENMFEFMISTPTLKTQFLLPRPMVNQMRGLLEQVLIAK